MVNIGILDLIITSYKLTINMPSYLQKYTQYPVDYTYNKFYFLAEFSLKWHSKTK